MLEAVDQFKDGKLFENSPRKLLLDLSWPLKNFQPSLSGQIEGNDTLKQPVDFEIPF